MLALSAIPAMPHNGRAFDASTCASMTVDPNAQPFSEALWCGSDGATKTVEQNQYDANGNFVNTGCTKYVPSFGSISQNELLKLAVLDVKNGNSFRAVDRIAACQCHSKGIERLIAQKGAELICFLRRQE
jgi:hypothetical protein